MSLFTAVDTCRSLRTLSGAGIGSLSGAIALLTLRDVVVAPIGVLASTAGCSPANMTGVIDRMEKQKLVERVRRPIDRRAVPIRLLPDGLSLLKRAGL